MSGLAGILAGHRAPGIYLWHAAFEPADVRHTVEHAGAQFGYVDGWALGTKDEFLSAVAEALDFPDHFGRNFDALVDCLGDLDTAAMVVLWDGWSTLARAEPDAFATVLEIVEDRASGLPPFSLLLRGPGPAISVPALDQ